MLPPPSHSIPHPTPPPIPLHPPSHSIPHPTPSPIPLHPTPSPSTPHLHPPSHSIPHRIHSLLKNTSLNSAISSSVIRFLVVLKSDHVFVPSSIITIKYRLYIPHSVYCIWCSTLG